MLVLSLAYARCLQVAPWCSFRPWLMADVSRLRPGSFRPWSWSDASRCAPGICPPGRALSCAPGRLPWLMADVSRWSPWCLLAPGLWLMLPGVAPGSFRSWSWSDASRLRPGSLVPGLWLMSPGCALVLARSWSWSDASRRSPWCSLVPGLCSMRSRLRPGSLVPGRSLQVCPWLARPWSWLMLPGGRPGSLVPGRG